MISAFGVDHGYIEKGLVQAYQDRKKLVQATRRMKTDPAYKQRVMNEMGAQQIRAQLAKNPAFKQTGPKSFESVKR